MLGVALIKSLDSLTLEEIKKYTDVSKTDKFGDIYLGSIEQILMPGESMLDPDTGDEILEDKNEDRVIIWWHTTPSGTFRSFDSRNRTFDKIYVEEPSNKRTPMIPVEPQCNLCRKFSLLGGICTENHEAASKSCFDQVV